MMSLPAMSLGLRFCASRKGGTGGGGQVSTLGPGNMAASGLNCRKPLVIPRWAISLFLCTNGPRKRSSGHDTIDLSDNEICKLDEFPLLRRLKSLLLNNNRIW